MLTITPVTSEPVGTMPLAPRIGRVTCSIAPTGRPLVQPAGNGRRPGVERPGRIDGHQPGSGVGAVDVARRRDPAEDVDEHVSGADAGRSEQRDRRLSAGSDPDDRHVRNGFPGVEVHERRHAGVRPARSDGEIAAEARAGDRDVEHHCEHVGGCRRESRRDRGCPRRSSCRRRSSACDRAVRCRRCRRRACRRCGWASTGGTRRRHRAAESAARTVDGLEAVGAMAPATATPSTPTTRMRPIHVLGFIIPVTFLRPVATGHGMSIAARTTDRTRVFVRESVHT